MTSKSTTTQTKQSKQSSSAWKPHAYQKKAIKFALQNSCAGLFLDPGLGKTSISLAAAKVLLAEKIIDCGLIIAPLRVCHSVWPKEIEKWDDFKDLRLSILHGKDKEKNLDKEADLYIINPEGLPWLLGHPKFKKKFRGQGLWIDESSKFKSTSSKRFKLLRPVLDYFARRYILTGSPAPNGLLDLFGQIFILDLGAALGRYITHYRNTYFYPTGFGGYEWKLQPGADKRIEKQIRPLTLRLDADDYLELPELIINPIYVDLPPKAREAYDEMEDELIAAIENREVVAASAAVASGKCSQIANGGIYDEDGKAHFIHDEKAQAVADLIEELGGSPALVAYEYGHDLDRLQAVLGKGVPYIGGGVSTAKSNTIEKAWNAGELPVLLGQPASVAHGLNLQNAGNHVIWHSLTWNFEYYDQFVRRVRRQGNNHNKVFVHHIIARNTVDELKLATLNKKFRTQKDLFDALNTFLRRKSLASNRGSGILGMSGSRTVRNPEEGDTTMSKFAKKAAKAEDTAAPAKGTKKPKLWTNDPKLQDQETGANTEAGDAQQTKQAAKVGKKEKSNDDAPKKKGRSPSPEKAKENAAADGLNPKAKITVVDAEGKLYRGEKNKYFEAIKGAKTVAAALEAGARAKDIVRAEEAGLIKLA